MNKTTISNESITGRRAYLSPEEIAKLVGISRWTVYRMIYDGTITSHRVGKLHRIPVREAVKHFPGLDKL